METDSIGAKFLMLKIKDDIDLYKLTEYGFEFDFYPNSDVVTFIPNGSRNSFSSLCHLNFYKEDRILRFDLQNGSHWCNSIEELHRDYVLLTSAYHQYIELVNKLIEDEIVEIVGDEDEV